MHAEKCQGTCVNITLLFINNIRESIKYFFLDINKQNKKYLITDKNNKSIQLTNVNYIHVNILVNLANVIDSLTFKQLIDTAK